MKIEKKRELNKCKILVAHLFMAYVHMYIYYKVNKCKSLNMRIRYTHHLGNFVHKILLTPNSSDIFKNKFVARGKSHAINIRQKNKFTIEFS